MMRARLLMLAASACLAACAQGEFQDLKEFVDKAAEGRKGRVEPLPQVQAYEAIAYNAFELQDPFQPRKVEPDKTAGAGPAPDLNRRKEALEAYPLESLAMVGTLEKARVRWALVRTPDNNLYRVKDGNYLGQNFGVVAMISDTTITLTELIQDTTGSWSERTSQLQLLDGEEKK
jgi:type IV pilus assembly protein PilP